MCRWKVRCSTFGFFTRARSSPEGATTSAKAVIRGLTDVEPSTLVEPYDKLGLYANRVTLSLNAPESTALALFDAFLAIASTGWAFIPFDEEWTAREAGWDERRADDGFLHPSIRAAFLGVEKQR
jgi:hypothetical protein